MSQTKKLGIIGAGPKGLAIAAKNQVLSELGFSVPKIHIVEKRSIGANWSGGNGFTNGKLHLGTSPEKDIGFPYKTQTWSKALNEEIDRRMLRFSWASFLIADGQYSQWIDRGRPAPTHGLWAKYLNWAAQALLQTPSSNTEIHYGVVVQIKEQGSQWILSYDSHDKVHHSLWVDGVVLTGPGKVKTPSPVPQSSRIFSIEDFWSHYERIRQSPGKIGVVGTGENAASIAMALASETSRDCMVEIISPNGMAFSRGESFHENSMYSDPRSGLWDLLSDDDKRNFINRTDRGVFSLYANSILSKAQNIEIFPGRLEEINSNSDQEVLVTLGYNGKKHLRAYDLIVVATGSDQWGFLKDLVQSPSLQGMKKGGALADGILEEAIGGDMSIEGLKPKLHLPMLSGMRQGPGFANLSCLGILSDRVLESYVDRAVVSKIPNAIKSASMTA